MLNITPPMEYLKEPGQTILDFGATSHPASEICKREWWLTKVSENKL